MRGSCRRSPPLRCLHARPPKLTAPARSAVDGRPGDGAGSLHRPGHRAAARPPTSPPRRSSVLRRAQLGQAQPAGSGVQMPDSPVQLLDGLEAAFLRTVPSPDSVSPSGRRDAPLDCRVEGRCSEALRRRLPGPRRHQAAASARAASPAPPQSSAVFSSSGGVRSDRPSANRKYSSSDDSAPTRLASNLNGEVTIPVIRLPSAFKITPPYLKSGSSTLPRTGRLMLIPPSASLSNATARPSGRLRAPGCSTLSPNSKSRRTTVFSPSSSLAVTL